MQPNFSSKARISSAGIAAPPDMQMRSVEQSAPSHDCEWSIALYIVGTPWKSVTLVALDDLERLVGVEARQHGDRRADAHRAVHRAGLAERVEQRQRAEEHVLLAHLAELLATRPASCVDRFACVSSAPFGFPVVPDV